MRTMHNDLLEGGSSAAPTRNIALCVALACLVGCASARHIDDRTDAHIREAVVEHMDNVRPSFRQAILNGTVRIGMTLHEAELAWAGWGPPLDSATTTTANGTITQYMFRRGRDRSRSFFTLNDTVVVIHLKN